MFSKLVSWLKSWFAKPVKESTYSYDTYHPGKRLIFTYWDGEKEIKADPQALYKKFLLIGKDLYADMKAYKEANIQEGIPIHDSIVKRLRDTFNLRAYEQNGLLDGEVVELFEQYIDFCEINVSGSSLSIYQIPMVPPIPMPQKQQEADPNVPQVS